MPFLAITRGGIASAIQGNPQSACLWLGSDVLSAVEIEKLRRLGHDVSVFVHPVRTHDEVEDAVATLREHHPNEPVWVEARPDRCNPRSADPGQAFLWQEYIVGADYLHNDFVQVVAGPHKGERGSLVSLVSLEPEPKFTLEAESGQDIQVLQSVVAHADA